jgi:hypothetical protein
MILLDRSTARVRSGSTHVAESCLLGDGRDPVASESRAYSRDRRGGRDRLAALIVAFAAFAVLPAAETWALDAALAAPRSTQDGIAADVNPSPTKDFWDKLESSGAVIGGALVALIGAAATYVYNRRQQSIENQQNEQNQYLQRVKTVGEILPHLSSSDVRAREAAIVVVGLLDPKLAAQLGSIYEDAGGLGALNRLTKSTDETTSQFIDESLQAISDRLAPAVVVLASGEGTVGTGFYLGAGDTIITNAYVIDRLADGQDVSVKCSDGSTHTAVLLRKDDRLAALRSSASGPALSLGQADGLRMHDRVYSLDHFGGMRSGEVGGYNEEGLLRISGMNTKPGSGGAPIVDASGHVVAVHYAVHGETGEGFAVPAEGIRSLLNKP